MSTTLYLKQQFNSAVGVSGSTPTYQYASLIRSVLTLATAVTGTTTAGSNIQMTKTNGGVLVEWISPPVAVGFTLSGTVTINLWAFANLVGVNTTVEISLAKFSSGTEGSSFLLSSFGTAVGTTPTLCNWTGSPSSTAFAVGDRLAIKGLITNATSLVMVGGDMITMDYAGLTAASDGDSFVTLTENVVFQTEGEIIQFAGSGSPVTFSGATTKGNAIVVMLGANSQAVSPSVTDNQNNAYLAWLPNFNWNGASGRDSFIYAQNIAGGASTSLTLVNSPGADAYEIGGVAPNAFDSADTSGNAGAAGTATSGAVVTVASNVIILGVGDETGAGQTVAGTGYVLLPNGGDIGVHRSVTGQGTYIPTTTVGSSWAMSAVALKWLTQPFGHIEKESGTGNISLENGNDLQLENALQ